MHGGKVRLRLSKASDVFGVKNQPQKLTLKPMVHIVQNPSFQTLWHARVSWLMTVKNIKKLMKNKKLWVERVFQFYERYLRKNS